MSAISRSRNSNLALTMAYESVVILLIVLASLRTYIFRSGFYDYADQFWNPIMIQSGIVPITFQGSYTSVLTLGKQVITWPGTIITNFFPTPELQGKASTLFTFVAFITFSFLLAELLYRLLSKSLKLETGLIGKEMLKSFFVVAIYCNIAIMNLNVDGGTYSDSFIMLLIAASVVFPLLEKNKIIVLAVTTSLLSISILLDPDYFLAFIVVIFVSFLVNSRYKIWQKFVIPATSVLFSFPVLYYVIEGLVITSVGISSPLAVRPIEEFQAYLGYNPIASMLLVGHSWSIYAISPPSILFLIEKSVYVPFYGNIVLLPNSLLTGVWVVTLSLYPFLSLSSLIFKGTRKITIPFAVVWLSGFTMTQWFRVPYLKDLFFAASNMPILGPAFGTAVSRPGHYMNVEGISEAILLGILVLNLLSERKDIYTILRTGGSAILAGTAIILVSSSFLTLYNVPINLSIYLVFIIVALLTVIVFLVIKMRRNPFHYRRSAKSEKMMKRVVKVSLVILVVFVVSMSGWQAFDGSFFPPRSYTGNSEGLLTSSSLSYSPFSPQFIPNYVVNAYSSLSSSSSFHTVLYSPAFPNNHFGYQDGILDYLVFNNYSFAIPSFMETESIKYIVTYKDSPSILSALNSSGLKVQYLGPSSYLYSVNNIFGSPYMASLLLNYSGGDNKYLFSYGIFESMGIIPVISNYGSNTLGLGGMSNKIDILPASNISSFLSPNEGINSTSILSNAGNVTLLGPGENLIANSWYIRVNSPPTTITISNRTLEWNPNAGKSISINYGNTTSPTNLVGIEVKNPLNVSVVCRITFQYNTSNTFSGDISANLSYIYNSSGTIYNAMSKPITFHPSESWKNATYSVLLPPGTGWFCPSINVNGSSGTVSLRNMNFSWRISPVSHGTSPYSSSMYLGNGTMELPGAGQFYFLLRGTGIINDKSVSTSSGKWITLGSGQLAFSGNLTLQSVVFVNKSDLKSLEGNYTVSDTPFSYHSRLGENGQMFPPRYTLTGQEVFLAPLDKDAKLILIGYNFVAYGFVLVISYVYLFPVLTILVTKQLTKRRRGKLEVGK